jgi:hypothetical protein
MYGTDYTRDTFYIIQQKQSMVREIYAFNENIYETILMRIAWELLIPNEWDVVLVRAYKITGLACVCLWNVTRKKQQVRTVKYCNGFDQRIARQQLGKHFPLVLHGNNGESIVVANVTARC